MSARRPSKPSRAGRGTSSPKQARRPSPWLGIGESSAGHQSAVTESARSRTRSGTHLPECGVCAARLGARAP
eukprot:10393645-Alexandrium_andersonii.AAC.1